MWNLSRTTRDRENVWTYWAPVPQNHTIASGQGFTSTTTEYSNHASVINDANSGDFTINADIHADARLVVVEVDLHSARDVVASNMPEGNHVRNEEILQEGDDIMDRDKKKSADASKGNSESAF